MWPTTTTGGPRLRRIDYPRPGRAGPSFGLPRLRHRRLHRRLQDHIFRIFRWTQTATVGRRQAPWARYHNNYRRDYNRPADDLVGGPGTNYLDERRVTLKRYQNNDSETQVEDSWKANFEDYTTGRAWAGRSVPSEVGSYPQVYYHDITEEGRQL